MSEQTISFTAEINGRRRNITLHTYGSSTGAPSYRVHGPTYRAEAFRLASADWHANISPAMAQAVAADPTSLESLLAARDACRAELTTALAAGSPLDTRVAGAYDTLCWLVTINGDDLEP